MKLSSFFTYLPALPSLPILGLGSNVQTRLLKFLLRKTIGAYIKGGFGDEDSREDQVVADLGGGKVGINHLVLEPRAFDPLLQEFHLRLADGTIGSITASLEWPYLCTTVDCLIIELETIASPGSQSASSFVIFDAEQDSDGDSSDEEYHELQASVMAVASDFVTEAHDTDQELGQSMIDFGIPGAFGRTSDRASASRKDSEEDPATIFASIIESLLNKLDLRVSRTLVGLTFVSDTGPSKRVEFHINNVVYADKDRHKDTYQEFYRYGTEGKIAAVSGTEMYWGTCSSVRIERPKPQPVHITSSNSDICSTSDSDSSENDLFMSQSIADLSQSQYPGTASVPPQIPETVHEEEVFDPFSTLDEIPDSILSRIPSIPSIVSNKSMEDLTIDATEPLHAQSSILASNDLKRIFSFGTAPIVCEIQSMSSKTLGDEPPKKPQLLVHLELLSPIRFSCTLDDLIFLYNFSNSFVSKASVQAPKEGVTTASETNFTKIVPKRMNFKVDIAGFSSLIWREKSHVSMDAWWNSADPWFPVSTTQRCTFFSFTLGSSNVDVQREHSRFCLRDYQLVFSHQEKVFPLLQSNRNADLIGGMRYKPGLRQMPAYEKVAFTDSLENCIEITLGCTKAVEVRLAPVFINIPLEVYDMVSDCLDGFDFVSPSSSSSPSFPSKPLSTPIISSSSRFSLEVKCPFIRVEMTCPVFNARPHYWRSSKFVLDLWNLNFGRNQVWLENCLLFVIPPAAKDSSAFLFVGSFKPDSELEPLKPTIVFKDSLEMPNFSISIPLLKVSVDKDTLDCMAVFTDTVDRWLSKLSKPVTREPRPMLEAQHFAAVNITDCKLEIYAGDSSSQTVFTVGAADIGTDVSNVPDSGLYVQLSLMEIWSNFKTSVNGETEHILSRLTSRGLMSTPSPMLAVTFKTKEKGKTGNFVRCKVVGLGVCLPRFSVWIDALSAFFKLPEGIFDQTVPTPYTSIELGLFDNSLQVLSPVTESQTVLSIDKLSLKTALILDSPDVHVECGMSECRVWVVSSNDDLKEASAEGVDHSSKYWKSLGFVQLVVLEHCQVSVDVAGSRVNMVILEPKLRVSVCADSLDPFNSCVSEAIQEYSPKKDTSVKQELKKSRIDLMASVDSDAFQQATLLPDYAELLDDDVPQNFDYLAEALNTSSFRESYQNPQQNRFNKHQGNLISNIDGETISVLESKGIVIEDDYMSTPREEVLSTSSVINIQCIVKKGSVLVRLHEGFDWFATRKALESEAKAVRIRLEKIRQLLASGQTEDASVDETSVLMFESVQLGLPPGATDLPTDQLIAAIDEELDVTVLGADVGEVESVAETWQTLPSQKSQKRTTTGKSRKSWLRSGSPAIEVQLRGVNATFSQYGPGELIASKLSANIDSAEILDNIKTSTWRKFLAELRPGDGGYVKPSETTMVKFEWTQVRPLQASVNVADHNKEEVLLRIKIAPLRLYIDQDALDFLKSFGSFENGKVKEGNKDEPFFQRVEVFPVRIKMDYKPKRVDYDALRKGRTAELMNFFHFDGSEMTLRHLVVSGIASSKLSDVMQDIWTPDVKAYQLADVISGITPVRSVVNIGTGMANLVLLPIEQYKKDGRVIRGVQRGLSSFSKTTTLEALNVGARLATGTQVILEHAEKVLGAKLGNQPPYTETIIDVDETDLEASVQMNEVISRYAAQPNDIREGMSSAYRSLGENFREAAQTILAVPMEVYERSSDEGPVRAVVRAVPIAVLKPMIGASEAMSKALLGLKNTLDPSAQAETSDKYKIPGGRG